MPNRKISLVVADDDPHYHEFITMVIQNSQADKIEMVGVANDGVEAIEIVKKRKPDVILLDLTMPRLGGLEAIPEIKKSSKHTAVVVFSQHKDHAHIVQAIKAGADDYLFKQDANGKMIVDHLLQIGLKTHSSEDKVTSALKDFVKLLDTQMFEKGVSVLTGMELTVLKMSAYTGDTKKEIAGKLNIAENTVKAHSAHIFEKLGATNMAHAVCLAIKHGIIPPGPAEPRRNAVNAGKDA
jgi:DNA-binding NarL/FixJ family response regulator